MNVAKFIIEDFHKDALDALDSNTVRQVMKKCLWAGAKVVEKETYKYIYANHKVSGEMAESVKQTDIHEDIDGCWVEIYPQGYDSRGVSNEMKAKMIVSGSYNKDTGKGVYKKDNYPKKLRESLEPRILSVMDYQFNLCMEELNK